MDFNPLVRFPNACAIQAVVEDAQDSCSSLSPMQLVSHHPLGTSWNPSETGLRMPKGFQCFKPRSIGEILSTIHLFTTRMKVPSISHTLWLFNIAMENDPSIDDFPIKTSIYSGFSSQKRDTPKADLPGVRGRGQ